MELRLKVNNKENQKVAPSWRRKLFPPTQEQFYNNVIPV